MITFEKHEEQIIGNGDPIIFKNQTNSPLSVNTGIVFKNDGIYRVMVDNGIITVDDEPTANILNWVPVSERTPDEKCTYLVTRRGINPDTRYIDICLWCIDKWFSRDAYINLTDVIAWVDNEIEPYKGD